ncbi:MAG: MqnA/MqnD/SBP family protein [Planctomycetota bacterium]
MTTLRLGISTCPNDTFAFHGLLTGAVTVPGVRLDFELLDVQELNEGLARGRFDAAKGSYFAAIGLADRLYALRAGSAVGRGVGPVLLGRRGADPAAPSPRVLGPGPATTAHLLLRSFRPELAPVESVVFSEIMPRLARGEADFGACIHEGRFTYREAGLELVEDLGATWERRFDRPLPLGGIFARADLEFGLAVALEDGIRRSLDLARSDPDATRPTMRRWAQELDDAVIQAHVDLYVDDRTRELDDDALEAVGHMSGLARAAGLIPAATPELRFPTA